MVDRGKVIDGLKRCEAGDKCAGCPYGPLNWAYCTGCLAQDALKLLKEQSSQIAHLEYDLAITTNNLNYYINGND